MVLFGIFGAGLRVDVDGWVGDGESGWEVGTYLLPIHSQVG